PGPWRSRCRRQPTGATIKRLHDGETWDQDSEKTQEAGAARPPPGVQGRFGEGQSTGRSFIKPASPVALFRVHNAVSTSCDTDSRTYATCPSTKMQWAPLP